MRRSHLCPACGTELCGVRAPADPVYGLAVVVCPGCGRAAVRSRDGLGRRFRRAVRCGAAAAGAAVQVAVLGAMVAMLSGIVWGMGAQLRGLGAGWWSLPAALVDRRGPVVMEWIRDEGWLAFGVMAAAALVCGLWLGSTMHHWRRWRLMLAFGGLLAIGLAVPVMADALERWLSTGTAGARWARWRDALGGGVLAMGCVALGMTGARVVWALLGWFRAARFGRMRGRIRRWRQA